jgi:shikimate dehydrogenase
MPTVHLGLFGQHIEQSPSPEIHKHFAKQFNIDLEYKKIIVDAENFKAAWQKFVTEGGNGANITIPHKLQAYALCTELSPAAQLAESVNTIKINSPSNWYGDNTDGTGLIMDLAYYHHSLAGKTILLLGAGGAAYGILPALLEQQPREIVLANRTLGNAEKLAKKHAHVSACELSAIPEKKFDIVINTSSELSLEDLTINFAPHSVAYDIRYKSGAKEFMHWAKIHGAEFVHDGYGMLLEQAAAAFNVWFSVQPSTQTLRAQYSS